MKGVSSPDTIRAYDDAIAMMDEAERLGEKPEDPLAYFAAGYGFWVQSHVAADHSTASLRADQFMARADRQHDTTPSLIGYRIKGISLTMLGKVQAGRDELTRAISGYRPEIHRPLAARFAVDFGISALLYRGLAAWLLGYPEAALKDADEGLKGARELAQAGPLMHSLFHSALPPMLCHELPTVEERARNWRRWRMKRVRPSGPQRLNYCADGYCTPRDKDQRLQGRSLRSYENEEIQWAAIFGTHGISPQLPMPQPFREI